MVASPSTGVSLVMSSARLGDCWSRRSKLQHQGKLDNVHELLANCSALGCIVWLAVKTEMVTVLNLLQMIGTCCGDVKLVPSSNVTWTEMVDGCLRRYTDKKIKIGTQCGDVRLVPSSNVTWTEMVVLEDVQTRS